VDLLGVTEMSMEWTWNVSAGEVKLGKCLQTLLDWHYPFGPRSFTTLIISTIMIWWSSSKISTQATK